MSVKILIARRINLHFSCFEFEAKVAGENAKIFAALPSSPGKILLLVWVEERYLFKKIRFAGSHTTVCLLIVLYSFYPYLILFGWFIHGLVPLAICLLCSACRAFFLVSHWLNLPDWCRKCYTTAKTHFGHIISRKIPGLPRGARLTTSIWESSMSSPARLVSCPSLAWPSIWWPCSDQDPALSYTAYSPAYWPCSTECVTNFLTSRKIKKRQNGSFFKMRQ